MPYALWLRKKTRLLSKDVTSKDGWRVVIQLPKSAAAVVPPPSSSSSSSAPAPAARSAKSELTTEVSRDTLVVTHIRKEKSFGEETNTREFYTFEARVSFFLRPHAAEAEQVERIDVRFPRLTHADDVEDDVAEAVAALAMWNMYAGQLARILAYSRK